ncbi:oxygenase MpaB family protein [Actinocorallia sp. B10E7]|uniref:oxygenase MpaB family protein n=1 Tax=Actinocorallia sp. B10E7 TaxID=3153558 RepID=UPI00325E7042
MTLIEHGDPESVVPPTSADPVKPAARQEPEPFGPGSLMWDSFGMYTSMLAGNSAFILQVMHPSIGTVVDQLSSFRTDPVGRAVRSFTSVQTWIYGGRTAIEEGKRLREMHKPLSAVDENGVRHHALSAEPWAWVHLTGFYAASAAARYFSLEPWEEHEQQTFDEFMRLGRILQVPERMLPPTIADYWTYFNDMVENTLIPHRTAYHVLDGMEEVPPTVPAALHPVLKPLSLSVGRLGRLIITGTLPPVAREKLGLTWTAADERKLRVIGRTIARTTPFLPERVRYMPIAYKARVAARAQQNLEHALETRPL